ncbi:hypothetical protein Bsp3421_000099 (plasmid) [Burkholderia sp. FERM BP-3421]|uniref:hypothetical protein n=1 Tax=Burkholderia sp. FERM BP-3421 TaxID=1494466 RepID=UPI0023616330|nr:hypothetical protein [Burkholderia sp. FERM BP-3421]WDD90276.1 hypothetical protein Bsp3421_000099 [Burkholderia sp. FERM BP-3421]
MPSPHARASRTIRVALCGLIATFPLAGCGLSFHDDNVEQQTSKALSTFQSGGLPSIGANTLSDEAKLDTAEVNASIALNQSMRRYDLARLLGDSNYIARKCETLKGRGSACPLLVFRDEVKQRRCDLACGASVASGDWQLLLFTDPTGSSITDQIPNDPSTDKIIETYNTAVSAYKATGRTDFTSCKTFKDPHEPDSTAAEKMFAMCTAYLSAMSNPRPGDQVLAGLTAAGVTGRIPNVKTALADRVADLKALNNNETNTAASLKDAQAKLTSAKASGNDASEVGKRVQDILNILDAADKGAATLGYPGDEPGAKLAAIKFRNTNLNAALHATVPASGASAAAAARGASGKSGPSDLAIASVISGVTTLAADGQVGEEAASAVLDLQVRTEAGMQAAVQAQIDAVKNQVIELENQQQAYVIEFVLLNATSKALDDAQRAIAHSNCKATNLGVMLESPRCAAAAVPLSEALTLYDRAWIEGRVSGNASEIRQAQLIRVEMQSSDAAKLDARVAVDTEALTALASAGKAGITPATIASFIQALATVVIAARVH